MKPINATPQLYKLLFPLFLLILSETSSAKISAQDQEALKIQIYLDQNNFMPGYLDGRPGRFTKLAIRHYNNKHGRKRDDTTYKKEALAIVKQPFKTVTVPKVARKHINRRLPYKKAQQVKVRKMSYRSYLEFMAERYRTSIPFLRKINSRNTIKKLSPGVSITVPNVQPFEIEKLKSHRYNGADPKIADRYVIIDTKSSQLKIYHKKFAVSLNQPKFQPTQIESIEDMENAIKEAEQLKKTIAQQKKLNEGLPPIPASSKQLFAQLKETDLIATFPITPGRPEVIRRGYWRIVNSVEFPTWRYDAQLLKTGKRSKKFMMIPGGPNNPVGVIWNGLSRSGIGIHGTNNPETIGRARSSGCVRLSNWDVAKFITLARPGAKVWLR